jgi:hypothetical protein
MKLYRTVRDVGGQRPFSAREIAGCADQSLRLAPLCHSIVARGGRSRLGDRSFANWAQEVWGAGVTYSRSHRARRGISRGEAALRPRIRRRATGTHEGGAVASSRVGDRVRIRRLSGACEPGWRSASTRAARSWKYDPNDIICDMKENPLYLPQAGLRWVVLARAGRAHCRRSLSPDTVIDLAISRGQQVVFQGRPRSVCVGRSRARVVPLSRNDVSAGSTCSLAPASSRRLPSRWSRTTRPIEIPAIRSEHARE